MKRTDYWPPEREQKLVELAPSAQQINDLAVALDVSRNAVIGKLARMRQHGVAIETNFRYVPRVGKRGAEPKPMPQMPKPRRGLPPPEPARADPTVFSMRRLTLMQLGPWTCRWPLGDAQPYLFCGNPTDPDRSYCPVHHRIARGR